MQRGECSKFMQEISDVSFSMLWLVDVSSTSKNVFSNKYSLTIRNLCTTTTFHHFQMGKLRWHELTFGLEHETSRTCLVEATKQLSINLEHCVFRAYLRRLFLFENIYSNHPGKIRLLPYQTQIICNEHSSFRTFVCSEIHHVALRHP